MKHKSSPFTHLKPIPQANHTKIPEFAELNALHLFPATLMLEHRNGSLPSGFPAVINEILFGNLANQTSLPYLEKDSRRDRATAYLKECQRTAISDEELQKWLNGKVLPPQRRIVIDQFCQYSLAPLSEKESQLTKEQRLKDLNHFVFIHRFEAFARYYPHNIAIKFNSERLSYQELNHKANRLAHYLLSLGIHKGDIIATFLPPEPTWLISLLAIWKVGAAFTSIDPTIMGTSPEDIDDFFLNFIQHINDAKPRLIITDSEHQCFLPPHDASNNKNTLPPLLLDEINASLIKQSVEDPAITVEAKDLAYVIYTSGSTGTPKGVEIEHRGLIPCLEAHRECVDLRQQDTMAQFAQIDFDAWIAEILILGIGGTLALVPSEIKLDALKLKQYYQQHHITIAILTPKYLAKLGGPKDFPDWRALFIVGEAFGWSLVEAWNPDQIQIVNGYGLVETTICTTLENLSALLAVERQGPIPIGRPIIGTEIMLRTPTNLDQLDYSEKTEYLSLEHEKKEAHQYQDRDKDDAEQIKPEIWVSGISLTRGYRGKAHESNGWRFITLPNGKTFYKTGDRGSCVDDNRYMHLGRYARIIKLNGKRVELAGVEAVVCQHPAVKDHGAFALGLSQNLGAQTDDILAIFLIAKSKEEPIDNILQHLRKKMPKVAGGSIRLLWWPDDKFPTKRKGKIDDGALRDYFLQQQNESTKNESQHSHPEEQKNTEITDDNESKLLSIWKHFFPDKQITASESFSNLGGKSIDYPELIAFLRNTFSDIKEHFDINFIFECQTLESQLQRIHTLRNPITPINLSAAENPDANYIVFFIPSILGNPQQDYAALAKQMPKNFQLYGLPARALTTPALMPTTIGSQATDYALAIRCWLKQQEHTRPVFVCGWSSGGVVVPSIVKRLQDHDITAFGYAIDSSAPFPFHHLTLQMQRKELIGLIKQLADLIGSQIDEHYLGTILEKCNKANEMIKYAFDHIAKKTDPRNHNIVACSRIIRLAEHNYFIRRDSSPFRLYKAKKFLLADVLDNHPQLHWPSKFITNPTAPVLDGDHFSVIGSAELASILSQDIRNDNANAKLAGLSAQYKSNRRYVVPNAEVHYTIATETECDSDLTKILHEFFTNNNADVMLLRGESGIGKSEALTQLLQNLKALDIPATKMQLNRNEFNTNSITHAISNHLTDELKWPKSSTELRVLLLDSFDELSGDNHLNYFLENKLDQFEFLKVIITCNTDLSHAVCRAAFSPEKPQRLIEVSLLPFTEEQIVQYVDLLGKQETYANLLEAKHNQSFDLDLMNIPQHLFCLLEGFEKLKPPYHNITLVDIYESYCTKLFEAGELKLTKKIGTQQKNQWQTKLRQHSQKIALRLFSEDLTAKSYQLTTKVSNGLLDDLPQQKSKWEDLLNQERGHLNKFCPITLDKDSVQFTHTSLRDFMITTALFDTFMTYYNNPDYALRFIQEYNITSSKLANNTQFNLFWRDLFYRQPQLKEHLRNFIYLTLQNPSFAPLAAVAITLRVLGGDALSGEDLRNVEIPTAVLDYAICDATDFRGSNLENVSAHYAYLANTNFKDCKTKGFVSNSYQKLIEPTFEDTGLIEVGTFIEDKPHIIMTTKDPNTEVYATLWNSGVVDFIDLERKDQTAKRQISPLLERYGKPDKNFKAIFFAFTNKWPCVVYDVTNPRESKSERQLQVVPLARDTKIITIKYQSEELLRPSMIDISQDGQIAICAPKKAEIIDYSCYDSALKKLLPRHVYTTRYTTLATPNKWRSLEISNPALVKFTPNGRFLIVASQCTDKKIDKPIMDVDNPIIEPEGAHIPLASIFSIQIIDTYQDKINSETFVRAPRDNGIFTIEHMEIPTTSRAMTHTYDNIKCPNDRIAMISFRTSTIIISIPDGKITPITNRSNLRHNLNHEFFSETTQEYQLRISSLRNTQKILLEKKFSEPLQFIDYNPVTDSLIYATREQLYVENKPFNSRNQTRHRLPLHTKTAPLENQVGHKGLALFQYLSPLGFEKTNIAITNIACDSSKRENFKRATKIASKEMIFDRYGKNVSPLGCILFPCMTNNHEAMFWSDKNSIYHSDLNEQEDNTTITKFHQLHSTEDRIIGLTISNNQYQIAAVLQNRAMKSRRISEIVLINLDPPHQKRTLDIYDAAANLGKHIILQFSAADNFILISDTESRALLVDLSTCRTTAMQKDYPNASSLNHKAKLAVMTHKSPYCVYIVACFDSRGAGTVSLAKFNEKGTILSHQRHYPEPREDSLSNNKVNDVAITRDDSTILIARKHFVMLVNAENLSNLRRIYYEFDNLLPFRDCNGFVGLNCHGLVARIEQVNNQYLLTNASIVNCCKENMAITSANTNLSLSYYRLLPRDKLISMTSNLAIFAVIFFIYYLFGDSPKLAAIALALTPTLIAELLHKPIERVYNLLLPPRTEYTLPNRQITPNSSQSTNNNRARAAIERHSPRFDFSRVNIEQNDAKQTTNQTSPDLSFSKK